MPVFPILFWIAVSLILFHLAGYSLLLFLLSHVLRNPVARREDYAPFISILVPAHNEAGVIKEKLESILFSTYPANKYEIIVADDGSTDGTAEQVALIADPRIILDREPVRVGKMSALNRAFRRSRGEIIVISDADVFVQPDALRKLIANFADPKVGCVSGHKVNLGKNELQTNENFFWRYESWTKTLESRLGSTPSAVGVLLGIRRELYLVPEVSVINDDFQMALNAVKLGYRVLHERSAVTLEKGGSSIDMEYSRKSRIAAGRWQLAGKVLRLAFRRPGFVLMFISHKLLRLFIFPLMILAFAGNLGAVLFPSSGAAGLLAFFALQSPWGVIVLAGQVLFYLLAGLGAALDSFGIRVKPLYFFTYFLNAYVAILSGFFQFSTGKQTVMWRKASR